METYRQAIRLYDGNYVTMVGMVSDLTGIVRSYCQNWRRPLAENRQNLQKAKKLGRTIVGVASGRSWRESALQDVLGSLRIQDGQMHHLVTHILTDARVAHQIRKQQVLHTELQHALHEGNRRNIWQISRELYRLNQQMLTPNEHDSSYSTFFTRRLEAVRREDPVMLRRIIFTLREAMSSQSERGRNEIPQPRSYSGEIEIYRSDQMLI